MLTKYFLWFYKSHSIFKSWISSRR